MQLTDFFFHVPTIVYGFDMFHIYTHMISKAYSELCCITTKFCFNAENMSSAIVNYVCLCFLCKFLKSWKTNQ